MASPTAAGAPNQRPRRDDVHIDLRPALDRADLLIAEGRDIQATEALLQALVIENKGRHSIEQRRKPKEFWKLKKWSETKDIFTELIRLAFTKAVRADNDLFRRVWDAITPIRENMRGNAHGDDIWARISNEVVSEVRKLAETAAVAASHPRNDISIVSAFTGIAAAKIAKDRFSIEPTMNSTVMSILNPRYLGHTPPMQRLFLKIAEDFLEICRTFHLERAFKTVCNQINRYLDMLLFKQIEEFVNETTENSRANERARALQANRKSFHESSEMMSKGMNLLALIQSVAVDLGDWNVAWESLIMTTRVMKAYLSPDRAEHVPIIVESYTKMGEMFLACTDRTYHAVCLRMAAETAIKRGKNIERLATDAVLAALAAPEINERRDLFGATDSDFRHAEQIAQQFGMHFPPSRTTLLEQVYLSNILQAAPPAAQQLFQLLSGGEVVDSICHDVETSLRALSQTVKTDYIEATFSHEIRRFALTRYFDSLSKKAAVVDLKALHKSAKYENSYEDDYSREIEPLLLSELGVPVIIDQLTNSATFTKIPQFRIQTAFAKLVTAATPAAKTPVRKPLVFTEADLENEIHRSIVCHELQKRRHEQSQNRLKAEKVREKEVAAKALDKRMEEEKKRADDIQEANEAKLAVLFQQAELKVRRKMLIDRLQEKYKHIKLPTKISERNANGKEISVDLLSLNQQSFINIVSDEIAKAQREVEAAKVTDVRQMDYFERACRELDIPKRKQIAESMAAELAEQREVRWNNYLEQHKKEYDARVAARQTLQKFLSSAEKFQEEFSKRTGKTSKRDEQQELIEKEKKRIAAEAEAEAAAEAKAKGLAAAAPAAAQPAPAAPAAAAAAPAPAAAPAAGGKWVPRSRQQQ